MAKKLQDFSVVVKVDIALNVPVQAERLEDALRIGKEFKAEDVVDCAISGTDINDSSIEVQGVWK